MRRTSVAKLGAGLTAAALALTLGTGSATADDSDTQVVRVKGVTPDSAAISAAVPAAEPGASNAQRGVAAKRVLPTADIIAFGQKSIVLNSNGDYAYEANPNITNRDGVNEVSSRLTVNGSNKGNERFQIRGPASYPDAFGLVLHTPANVPLGKAKLGPSTISYYESPRV